MLLRCWATQHLRHNSLLGRLLEYRDVLDILHLLHHLWLLKYWLLKFDRSIDLIFQLDPILLGSARSRLLFFYYQHLHINLRERFIEIHLMLFELLEHLHLFVFKPG